MISTAQTDVGRAREQNEDFYRLKIFSDSLAYGIVCDGMGGANGGQIASQTVANYIADELDIFFTEQKPPYDVVTLLRGTIRRANDQLYKMSRSDPMLEGMGTTLVMAIIVKDELYVANIGDSRAYLFEGDSVQQITIDHSAVQDLVDMGQITPEEAKNHPQKNIITRAVGVDSMVEFDCFTYRISRGNKILLCSDGLSNYFDDKTLLDIVSSDSVVGATEELIDYANCQGGQDNITALLIKID